MGERIVFDKNKTVILLFSRTTQSWEDQTSSITALYTGYFYGNFTGYDIYLSGSNKKYFYTSENVRFLNVVRKIDIEKYDILYNGNLVHPNSLELLDLGYYRMYLNSQKYITRSIELKKGQYKDIFNYYFELASYAYTISNEDEPLYFLSLNYQRIQPTLKSVLYQYLEGVSKERDNSNELIIVPFDFNQSQYQAIEIALRRSISVIEGPPGTGKTQTILNLISNIIASSQNCAVVSNNNTAIDNVYEKLSEEGLSFITAALGRQENVERFFENETNSELITFLENEYQPKQPISNSRMKQLVTQMKDLQEIEVKLARLKNELNDVLIEQRNQVSKDYSLLSINRQLTSSDYVHLIHRIEQPKKIRLLERWRINYKYQIKIQKQDLNELLQSLETLFYQARVQELTKAIDELNSKLISSDKTGLLMELKDRSKDVLLDRIYKHYQNLETKEFNKNSYKRNYTNFLNRYPIVLSTSQSLLNNAPSGFLFDYLIIDEASQGDLLSSVLAMSCAKNLVVVGDSIQLQQIEEERLFEYSKKIANKYNIPTSYLYESNSILKSVRDSIQDVPITLLREHYRCAPDIINFCNKMFYSEELIPMTSNFGQHIEIIKTVPGNHARKNPYGSGLYNQREIDEIIQLISNRDYSKIGIITPFRYQAKLLQEQLHHPSLEADTIHKFQGRQKDEVVLSFVVNSLEKEPEQDENRLYDFVTNEKLLNVAISRGKNKVTAIVSDKIYHSKNNIIHNFIRYAENLYGNMTTKSSSVTSVFDYLYSEYDELIKKRFKNHPQDHITEILLSELIDDVLKSFPKIGYSIHVRLSKLISDTSSLSNEEMKYVMHPWTHVDFLFFNKITKERLFVIEVDGIQYHEKNFKQQNKDSVKDKVLTQNNVQIHRFKTNQSDERVKLINILNSLSK